MPWNSANANALGANRTLLGVVNGMTHSVAGRREQEGLMSDNLRILGLKRKLNPQ